MKKVVLVMFVLVFLLIVSGCNILEKKDKGPGGCTGKECEEYCKKNPEECREWCNENPELCEKILKGAGHEEPSVDFPEGFPSGINPQECQQNPQKCIEFCEKNPGVCPEEHLRGMRGLPSGFQEEAMTLPEGVAWPGNCKDTECIREFCQQNPVKCQEWAEENPEVSSFIRAPRISAPAEKIQPPATIINYAKSVSLFDFSSPDDVAKAKELGTNMISLWPPRRIKDDEFIFSPERISNLINIAHQNGLQVELRGSYSGKEEEPKNYNKFKENILKHVAEFAKFAEEYKVYRIAPFGEIDNNMINNCDKITELSKEMLNEMRKYYSGKIGIGVVAPWRDCGFNFEGYDFLTVSLYPQVQTGMDAWLTTKPEINLISVSEWAREVADRSNIKILHVGETGVQNIGETDPRGDFETVQVSKEKEAEYYEKLFGLISDKINGIAVYYSSGFFHYMSVNGDPAEEVVKEWYNKLGPGVEIKEEITKLIVANPIDISQVVRISKFRSCAGHDYSGFNINWEKEPISSMKHYILANKQLVGAKDTVKIFAPFDGKITEIRESDGKQIFISSNKDPKWHFIFFHTSPLLDIQVGAYVKAGQLIGQGYMREWDGFDIAFKQFSLKGQIFDSPFMHMSNKILKEYELRGVTTENIIISKEFRENNPCPIRGTKDGDVAFSGETEKDDFVILK